MSMRLHAVAIVVALSAFSTAEAQTPERASWTGFHAGVAAGARFATSNWTTTGVCPTLSICAGGARVGPDFQQGFDSTGLRVGGYAGHSWQIAPSWVVGVEADFGWAANRRTNGPIPGTTLSGGSPAITNGDTAFVNPGWDGSLRGRVGTLVAPSTLLYATGGVAVQEVTAGAACNNDGSNLTYCTEPAGVAHAESFSQTLVGWTVGGGVERMVMNGWLLRLEYRYADFGRGNLALFASNFSAVGDDRLYANVQVRTHTVNAGIAYRF